MTDTPKSLSPMTRRAVMLGAGATVVGGALFASNWYNVAASAEGESRLTVQQAHTQAISGDTFLIDIRRPDEWTTTGVGEGAHPIDMRRQDFTDALLAVTGGDTQARIALICARGVRSRHMTARLTQAGFTNILDVPEGMLGSGAGPGWLGSNLPVVAYEQG